MGAQTTPGPKRQLTATSFANTVGTEGVDVVVGGGVQGPINPGNVRADPGIFDRLLELFRLKEKTNNENQEDSEERRDPSW